MAGLAAEKKWVMSQGITFVTFVVLTCWNLKQPVARWRGDRQGSSSFVFFLNRCILSDALSWLTSVVKWVLL